VSIGNKIEKTQDMKSALTLPAAIKNTSGHPSHGITGLDLIGACITGLDLIGA
jgi:hypothetical protein